MAIGALRARSSSPGNELRLDDVDRRPSLKWSPPKRRKAVVQVVSSTDFGWARDLEHERQVEERQSLSSEQAITKPVQKLVSPRKAGSCNAPRRVIGEKFWELDGTHCCRQRNYKSLLFVYIACNASALLFYGLRFGVRGSAHNDISGQFQCCKTLCDCCCESIKLMHCVASFSIDTCCSSLNYMQSTTAEYAWKRFHVRSCPW